MENNSKISKYIIQMSIDGGQKWYWVKTVIDWNALEKAFAHQKQLMAHFAPPTHPHIFRICCYDTGEVIPTDFTNQTPEHKIGQPTPTPQTKQTNKPIFWAVMFTVLLAVIIL